MFVGEFMNYSKGFFRELKCISVFHWVIKGFSKVFKGNMRASDESVGSLVS